MISGLTKFHKFNIIEEQKLTTLDSEKKLKDIIKLLYEKNCFTKAEYDKIYPTGSKQGIGYDSAKVKKLAIDNCLPFRPILLAIGITSYNLAKLLVGILSPLTEDEFTVQDSFLFLKEIIDLNYDCLFAGPDVEWLVTDISPEEIIDSIINDLVRTKNKVHSFEKDERKQLLKFAACDSFFVFDNDYNCQIDDVAIGSPLRPTFVMLSYVITKNRHSQTLLLIFNS